MKKAIIVTARAESTRLPGKMMLPLQGKPVIQHVMERAKTVPGIDCLILMTPASALNDPMAKLATAMGLEVSRDSGADRLGGLLDACKRFEVDMFATMDGDDPLCDPYLITKAFEQLENHNANAVTTAPGMICGAFTLCATTEALAGAYAMRMLDSGASQTILPYIQEACSRVETLEEFDGIFYDEKIRLTLDYQEDYAFFRALFKELAIYDNDKSLYGIAAFLKERPDLVAINAARREDWAANQVGMK